MIFGFCPECHALLQEDGGGHHSYCAIVQGLVAQLREELNVTVEAPEAPSVEYDWSGLTAQAVRSLRKPKVKPVPARIVQLAQASFDGVPDAENTDGPLLHVLEHTFETAARAASFAKVMKQAGVHTTPPTSLRVVIDPENDGSDTLVRWRAGTRKGSGASA